MPAPSSNAATTTPRRKHRRRPFAALKFVGKPKVVFNDGVANVEITVVNTGPVDVGIGFEVRWPGGTRIEVANPEIVVSAGKGPVTVQLALPPNSGVTANSRLEVVAGHSTGHSVAVGVTGGLSGVTKVALTGVIAISGFAALASTVSADIDPPPPLVTPDVGPDEEEPIGEPPEDETEEQPEEVNSSGRYEDRYHVSSGDLDVHPVVIDLRMIDGPSCQDCRYEVVFNGFEAGTVTLDESTSDRKSLAFTVPEHPIGWGCFADDTDELIESYRRDSDWRVDLNIEADNGALWIDAEVAAEFSLPGGPDGRCYSPLTVVNPYSNRPSAGGGSGESNEGGNGGGKTTEETVTEPEIVPEETELDVDGDGVADPDDNCPEEPNGAQVDADQDLIGDACDDDDDNDGLSDNEEVSVFGTDPTLVDTDGGGIDDRAEVDGGADPLDPDDDVAFDAFLIETGLLIVDGTWMADIDTGELGDGPGDDFWWHMITEDQRELLPTGGRFAHWPGGFDDVAGCAAQAKSSNAISASGVDYGSMAPGTRLCVETNEGNIAILQVLAIDPERNHAITLEFALWEPKRR